MMHECIYSYKHEYIHGSYRILGILIIMTWDGGSPIQDMALLSGTLASRRSVGVLA